MLSAPRDQVGSGGPFAGEVVARWRSVYAGVMASIVYNSLYPTGFTVLSHSNALRGVAAVSAVLGFGGCGSHTEAGGQPRPAAGRQHHSLPLAYVFLPLSLPRSVHVVPRGGYFVSRMLLYVWHRCPLCRASFLRLLVQRDAELSRSVPVPNRASVASRGMGCWGCSLQSPLLKSTTLIYAHQFAALKNSACLGGRKGLSPDCALGRLQRGLQAKHALARGEQSGSSGSGSGQHPLEPSIDFDPRLSLRDVGIFTQRVWGQALSEPSPGAGVAARAPGTGET